MEPEADSEGLLVPTHTHLHGACWHLSALSGLFPFLCSTMRIDTHSLIRCSSSIHRDATPHLRRGQSQLKLDSSLEAVGKLVGHMPSPGVPSWLGKDVWKPPCNLAPASESRFFSHRSCPRSYRFSVTNRRNRGAPFQPRENSKSPNNQKQNLSEIYGKARSSGATMFPIPDVKDKGVRGESLS